MVKNNVEELGGSVTVDSQIGRGTEFHLKIALTRTLVTKESLFIEDQGKFFTVPSAEVERVVELNRDQLRDHDGHLIAVIQDAVYYFRTLNDCFDSTSAAPCASCRARAPRRPIQCLSGWWR